MLLEQSSPVLIIMHFIYTLKSKVQTLLSSVHIVRSKYNSIQVKKEQHDQTLAFDHVALVETFELDLNSTHILSDFNPFPALNLIEIVCIPYTGRS